MKETLYPSKHPSEMKVEMLHDGFCERCFSDLKSHFVDSFGRILCTDCYIHGVSSSNQFIYRHERNLSKKAHIMKLEYELSEEQIRGSLFFQECIESIRSGFIEAVCGAGKTEMLYLGFLNLLKDGKRICFAIPRKQIVIQIEKRLKEVFPLTGVKAIHGDAKDDSDADILVSTMPQLIHYYHEFDVLVIDEVDAYPLEGNPMLHRLIHKSLKPEGILFLISATTLPSIEKYLIEFQMNQCNIYRKFHNVPQDIPKFMHVRKLYLKLINREVPKQVLKVLETWMANTNTILIFVPTIRLARIVNLAISSVISDTEIITSKTSYKNEVLRNLMQLKTRVLISTSILERGVTFPKLNVMVLFSDHLIFTKEMLIQISGRVGRKLEYPTGEIVFVSEYLSIEMKSAVRLIVEKNKKGFV